MKKIVLSLFTVFLFIKAEAQTQQQIDNQIAFAKIYGYVKYFYPGDEAAAIDWDKFAIYGVKQVTSCTDRQTLKQTLTDLFKPIAPALQIAGVNENVIFDKQTLIPPSLNSYKTIAWQHVGAGILKYKESPYQSARTNRDVFYLNYSPKPQLPTFGSIAKGLDAVPYQNKQFLLKGRAKLVAGAGSGHLWARVVKNDKTNGFFDNMNNAPIKSTEWKDFEIKGTIDSNARELRFGALLSGRGDFFVDDISVSIKDGNTWKEIYANTFNEEKTGTAIKDIFSDSIKYSNPNYIFSIVEDINSPGKKWAEIKSISNYKETPAGGYEKHTVLFKAYPKVGEYISKTIGSGLKITMPISLYGNVQHTFPLADSVMYIKLKNKLARIPPDSITPDSLATRAADLIITWNVFQHFFPYFDVVKTDWQQDLADALAGAQKNKNGGDFEKTLKKFTARLQDGHICVSWLNDKSVFYPPISWGWVENQLVITDVWNSSVALKKGDVITAINNEDPKDYFIRIEQYLSAATPGNLMDRAQMESLSGDKGSILQLSYLSNDNIPNKIRLNRNLTEEAYYDSLAGTDSLRQVNKDIMYINMGLADMKAINKVLPQLQKSKAIICDFRNCMVDNDNNHFIEYLLTQKDTASHWMQIPQIIYPDQQHIVGYTSEGFDLKPAKPHLNAKIVFLIDGSDISWSESYMSIIDHYKLATIIGQPTGGTNGDVNYLTLPGSYYITFTGLKVTQLDGTTHHGVGTKPNVYVAKTIRGIRENKDAFLEKAIELAESPEKQ